MDDFGVLDNLAIEMQLNHPLTVSIFSPIESTKAATCGGCGAKLVSESTDGEGRLVKDYACGHRYRIGSRTVLIERA